MQVCPFGRNQQVFDQLMRDLTVNTYLRSVTMVSVYRIYLLASDSGVEPMVSGLEGYLATCASDWLTNTS